MSFAPGSLVRTRHREWVVLPESTSELLRLRPLGGGDDEVAGVLTDLEMVEPATFSWPDPAGAGDYHSARLLRDAARLGFRSSAGPFRSFGSIAVEPRPYQLVPLLMALKLDPVRLLIADDVGTGKTIEAGLIAKELLTTGQASRLSVICPPHLAEQWQAELSEKFHIEAELVLASTASRLERTYCTFDESIFDVMPYTVVSMDFIKSERRRDEFVRTAPDLLIVDEAHTCSAEIGRGGFRHQRHELLRRLAADPERNIVLVTATPHSGNEGTFRSLLGLLDPSFEEVPPEERMDERTRDRLAARFVQRRREDLRKYLDEDTPFPDRLVLPEEVGTYHLTAEYREFVDKVVDWARQTVADESGGKHRQRVRWWGVLGLLRALASSPAAAAETLRNRAAPAMTATVEEADAVGRSSVLDQDDADDSNAPDAVPGADADPDESSTTSVESRERRVLRQLAEEADGLVGPLDAKLVHATKVLRKLVSDGFYPILFCRFIATADYLAAALRLALPSTVTVESITGVLPAAERKARVTALGAREKRVLVATDCLSEGINLQELFNAVVHYDLPWNPTRLEQREGRVDRYGQPSPEVRVATIIGGDNIVDETVLQVLLRKHRTIRSELGISIPVPGSNDEFIETIFDRLFHQGGNRQLNLFAPDVTVIQQSLFVEWERAAAQEKESRSRFAQRAIKTDEVAAELRAARQAIGSVADVRRFVRAAVRALGGSVETQRDQAGRETDRLILRELPRAARDLIGADRDVVVARYDPTLESGEVYLERTSPLVGGLASYLLDVALDVTPGTPASRCGAIRTNAVTITTTLLLVRYRFDIELRQRAETSRLLAEDLDVLGFEGPPSEPTWIDTSRVTDLLDAEATQNIDPEQRERFLSLVVRGQDALGPELESRAYQHAEVLAETHRRIRAGARATGRIEVNPHLPVDVLGLFLLVPDGL
jgi:superfamily II DNA or RNA helicase